MNDFDRELLSKGVNKFDEVELPLCQPDSLQEGNPLDIY